MAGATGATGATSTGMQDTGSTSYQQSGYPQQGYGQAPGRSAEYGTSGYGRSTTSRPGAALSILAGALAFLEGLAFVIRSHFYPAVPGYAYRWTLHGWGWTLLILGALLFAGGVSNLLGIKGSRQFTAAMAVITAVVAFLLIFYSVVWSIVVVGACVLAAQGLLTDRGRQERYGADSTGQHERQEAMSQGKGSHRM